MAKSACSLVKWMAVVHPVEFGTIPKGGNGLQYFKDDALCKLIGCGIKTISDLAHLTIVEILENCDVMKIATIFNGYLNSKNAQVRLRTA